MNEKVEKWFSANYDEEFFMLDGYTTVSDDLVVVSFARFTHGELEYRDEVEVAMSEIEKY